MKKKKKPKQCEVCGGTGQVSYFKGVSRFLLSNEECEACAGTGLQMEAPEGDKGKKRAAK